MGQSEDSPSKPHLTMKFFVVLALLGLALAEPEAKADPQLIHYGYGIHPTIYNGVYPSVHSPVVLKTAVEKKEGEEVTPVIYNSLPVHTPGLVYNTALKTPLVGTVYNTALHTPTLFNAFNTLKTFPTPVVSSISKREAEADPLVYTNTLPLTTGIHHPLVYNTHPLTTGLHTPLVYNTAVKTPVVGTVYNTALNTPVVGSVYNTALKTPLVGTVYNTALHTPTLFNAFPTLKTFPTPVVSSISKREAEADPLVYTNTLPLTTGIHHPLVYNTHPLTNGFHTPLVYNTVKTPLVKTVDN